MIINSLLKSNPFSLNAKTKSKIFSEQIKFLTIHHYKNCKIYKKIIKNLKFKVKNKNKVEDFPMLPVRLFKKFDLKSVPDNKVVKKLETFATSKSPGLTLLNAPIKLSSFDKNILQEIFNN